MFIKPVFPLFGFSKGKKIGIFGFPFYKNPSFKRIEGGIDQLRKTSYSIESYSLKYDIDFHDYLDGKDYGNLVPKFGFDFKRIKFKKNHNKYIFLGGEHTITPFILRNFEDKEFKLVWFDAHADLREKFLGDKFSHACALKRVLDFFDPNNVLIVGVRSVSIEEKFDLECLDYITSYDFKINKKHCLSKIKEFCKDSEIYVSFDVDVLDPMYVPGVGTPEFEGLNYNDILDCFDQIKNIFAIDFVEFGDDEQHITTTCVASLIKEILFKWCMEYV